MRDHPAGDVPARHPHSVPPCLAGRPVRDGRSRLFCFHHAGGSASVFSVLRAAVAGSVDVIAVQLPGRERRLREPVPTRMPDLVAELDDQLAPYLDERPFAFYGHSMGALVAHDLAARRAARGARSPSRLLVGAARAPHLPPAFAGSRNQPDEALRRTMVAIGGLSEQTARHPSWSRAAITLTRADLRLCAGRVGRPSEPVPYPIDAFHGSDDPIVAESDITAWARHTTSAFTPHWMPGGHFFLIGAPSTIFAARVADVLLGSVERQEVAQ